MDKLKSIAVPVTRRDTGRKSRRAGHPQLAPDQHVGGHVGPARREVRLVPDRPVHRFRVGQRLRVLGGGTHWARSGGYCRVVALMPHESGPFLYRIRSELESFERVVAETDLSPELP